MSCAESRELLNSLTIADPEAPESSKNVTEVRSVIGRNMADAPDSATKNGIKTWLIGRGAMGVLNVTVLSVMLGCCKRIIQDAIRSGDLPCIDKCTFTLDAASEWLVGHPRLVAQQFPFYSVSSETFEHALRIMPIIAADLLGTYNNDVRDLALEVCFRISKRRNKPSKCYTENSLINWAVADIRREYRKHANEISIDEINEEVEHV